MFPFESDFFSEFRSRELVKGLITPSASGDSWGRLRLLRIAARYQLGENEVAGVTPQNALVSSLLADSMRFGQTAGVPEETRQDIDFRSGMMVMLEALFNPGATQKDRDFPTVEQFVAAYFPHFSERSALFRAGKDLAWQYTQYMMQEILEGLAQEPVMV